MSEEEGRERSRRVHGETPRVGQSASWALEGGGKPAWERLDQGSERRRQRRGGAGG